MTNYSLKSYLQIIFFINKNKTTNQLRNAFWNKWPLRAFLKPLTEYLFLIKMGRSFHNFGAAV